MASGNSSFWTMNLALGNFVLFSMWSKWQQVLMTTWLSSGLRPKRASCASTVHSGRCSAQMTCSRSMDADLARLSALTSQPVSTTMLRSAPSISHIVSGERSPVIVTAPKSSSSSQPVGRMAAWSVRSTPAARRAQAPGRPRHIVATGAVSERVSAQPIIASGCSVCARHGGVMVHVPPSDRMAFLAERRALSVQRFDAVHSPHYDQCRAPSAPPMPICSNQRNA
jgi:hypothetical protein